MPELDWENITARLRADQGFGAELKHHIENELALAKSHSTESYSGYLNALSGIGVFAVKGTVYVPRFTKAFGDWILLPNQWHPEIVGMEENETHDEWPYFKGKVAFVARHAHIQSEGSVTMGVEAYTESAYPRVLYPNDLERFDLYRINRVDILENRDQRYTSGVLKFLAES